MEKEKTGRMKNLLFVVGLILSLSGFAQVNVPAKQLRLLNNIDSTGLGSITGIVRYDPATGKYRFYNALTSTWFSYGLVNIALGTDGQIPYMNSSGNNFGYSNKLKWDNTNNRFIAGAGTTSGGTNNANFGPSTTTLSGSWALTNAEESTISGNNSLSSGWFHTVTASASLTVGTDHSNANNGGFCGGVGARTLVSASTERAGFAWAFQTSSANGRRPTGVPYVTANGRAFNISRNTSAQTDGNGALAVEGGILGGIDNHIPADAVGSVMIGCNTRVARSDTWQAYFENLNILSTPSRDDTLTQIFARDRATGQMKWRSASSIAGGAISGLTTNRIIFATSSTSIGDDSALTWDATNNAMTVDGANAHATGTDNLFFGDNSGNFSMSGSGGNTGIGKETLNDLTSGAVNTAVGSNALKLVTSGNANCAFGADALAACVTGLSNVAVGYGALQLTTASTNIGIGLGAGDNLTSGGNNIVIGAQLDAASATATGQMNIHGIIFGTGNGAVGTAIATGNIGIGTAYPDRRFHVESNTVDSTLAVYSGRFTSLSTSTSPDAGFGTGIEFEVETTTSNNEVGATIDVVTTDVTATSEDFDVVIKTMAAGAVADEKLRIKSTGDILATYSGTQYILAKTLTNTAVLNFSTVGPGESIDLTITVTGAADGDAVYVGVPNNCTRSSGGIIGGISYFGWVSSPNTVTIRVCNFSVSSYSVPSGTFRAVVTKY